MPDESLESVDDEHKQKRLWSACASAQADQSHYCLYTLQATFLRTTARHVHELSAQT